MSVSYRRPFGLIAVLSVVMAGCATTPPPVCMPMEEPAVQTAASTPASTSATVQAPQATGSGVVYVLRPSDGQALIPMQVSLDSTQASAIKGTTSGGQYLTFPVSAGQHRLYSMAENQAELIINVKDGETLYVQMDTGYGFSAATTSLRLIDASEGQKLLKTLQLAR